MTKTFPLAFTDEDRVIDVPAGTSILAGAEEAGIDVEALCGGDGVCGTCAVVVEAGGTHFSPIAPDERAVLSDSQIDRGYRLGCRATVEDGAVSVSVPPASRLESGIIMTEGRSLDIDLQPALRLYPLHVSQPSLDDTVADLERVYEALEREYDLEVSTCDRLALRNLPNTLRAETGGADTSHCTAAVYGGAELVALFPGRRESTYGIAVDVGTTTLAVYLVDLRTGEQAAVTSRLNPQRTHGSDIVSRVAFTQNDPDGGTVLQQEILEGVNEMVAEVTRDADVAPADILDAVFVGNTAMHHLFLGIDASPVAASPYVPANHAILEYKARELGLEIHESATLSWLPVVGGWVGPDFVADLLVANALDRDEPTVYMDIGTNGEIAVSTGDRILAASAPAGPALEGAEITQGVQAKQGAIERVDLDPETWAPDVKVIGGGRPMGICGSGILDAVGQLFLVGAIDRRGGLEAPGTRDGRIRESGDGELEFLLLPAAETAIDDDIVVSQSDIREIQHAKAAIQTGTNVLLELVGLDAVDRLVMAGGFGNAIAPESARLLGMYPEARVDEVEFLGNAAGYGAQYALLDERARSRSEAIVEAIEYVELAAVDGFHDEFMEAMFLPHHDLERYPGVCDVVPWLERDEDAL